MKRAPNHGMARTPEYVSWRSMMTRCFNENHKSFHRYGGRGITVCEEWQTFQNFYADMYPRPEGHSLERINSDLGYYPENCKWSSRLEQSNNLSSNVNLTFNGKTQSVSMWARELDIPVRTLHNRIANGWTTDKALTTPRKKK